MRCCCVGDERRVHQSFRRDAQFVGHVDDVHDERALDAAVLEDDVEVAERSGMSPRGARAAAYDRQYEQGLRSTLAPFYWFRAVFRN